MTDMMCMHYGVTLAMIMNDKESVILCAAACRRWLAFPQSL
jgi:hypothetical protein